MSDVKLVEVRPPRVCLAGSVLDAGDEQQVRLSQRADGTRESSLAGEGGACCAADQAVLEAGLEAKMTSHLGCYKHNHDTQTGIRPGYLLTRPWLLRQDSGEGRSAPLDRSAPHDARLGWSKRVTSL